MEIREHEGGVSAEGKRFAVIVSKFNFSITKKLLDGAIECFKKNGAENKTEIDVYYCPGAFELPQTASFVLQHKQYHAVVCLGSVIRGETPHFDYICQECARGIGSASQTFGVPIMFGVLTTNTYEQAEERAGGSVGNKGFDAALAAITMADLYSQIS